MSKKTSQLFMLAAAFLLLYLATTSLSGIPGIICMVAAIGLCLVCMVQMIMDIRGR